MLAAAALAAALLAMQGLPAGGGLQAIRQAAQVSYRLGPEPGTGAVVQETKVDLPNRFDRRFKGQSGSATYVVPLPGRAASGPVALLFPRVGNQVEFRLNGHWLAQRGAPGNSRFDAARSPTWLPLPDELLRSGSNTLEVTIHAQPGRWSGLSNGLVGPADALGRVFRVQLAMRTGAGMAFAVSMLFMGVLALGLWWHEPKRPSEVTLAEPGPQGSPSERRALYLCFAAAAIAGALPNLDRVLAEAPMNAVAWSTLVAVARAWHIALMCGFLLMLSGVARRAPWRVLQAYLPLAAVLAVLGKTLAVPLLWEICLGLLMPVGLYSLWHVARRALQGEDRYAWPLLASGAVAAVASVHDYGTVLLGLRDETHFAILPHATFLIVISMGWVIVERYARALREHHELAQTLDQRVREREASLRESLAALRASEREQAMLGERQRIMRDIHDGVGAQLVGLISLVGHDAARAPLREHAQAALDELRIAVDALQTAGDDLATVLGTTRYRLQQRFDAAGIAFDWQVDAVPPAGALTPAAVMHVQRILHEALTNVLKHARAGNVRVALQRAATPDAIVLTIEDDGGGLPAAASAGPGHGLRNMHSRAEAIGGRLTVGPSARGGTCVQLSLPLGAGA
jgi:signal transduction histidine kinase